MSSYWYFGGVASSMAKRDIYSKFICNSLNCYIFVLYTEYQPNGRSEHRSDIVGNKLYIRSGYQKDCPEIHDSESKQRYNSRVEILNLTTGNWRQCTTTGNPPLSVDGYASAVIDNDIIYFGGYCGHTGCYHNSVHSLCVDTMHWKELFPTNPHTGPSMKFGCRMITVKIDGKNYLLVIGGQCPSVNTPQQDTAQYITAGNTSNIRTNEHHFFDLSTGKYRSYNITSDVMKPYISITVYTYQYNSFNA